MMITFEQVTKRYGERLALDSVSWGMDEGECVVFLGPSGAGKTTLLRLITHEVSPSAGIVTVGTFRGSRLSRARRALLRRTLGIVYEDFRLLADRSVFENVALAVRIAGLHADIDVTPRVEVALDEVGLSRMSAAFPSELSFGEKQRAAIARAIVNRPAVVLADEPTGALEPRSAHEVLALLARIHHEGSALLVATTREEVATMLGGRILRLEEGRMVGGDPNPESARAPAAAPAVAEPQAAPPAPDAPPSAAAPVA
jgi:cell division transport system ATP-binding protein